MGPGDQTQAIRLTTGAFTQLAILQALSQLLTALYLASLSTPPEVSACYGTWLTTSLLNLSIPVFRTTHNTQVTQALSNTAHVGLFNPVIQALGKLKQEGTEFEASLDWPLVF